MHTPAILANYLALLKYSHSNVGVGDLDIGGENSLCVWKEKEDRDMPMRFFIMGA